MGIQVIILNFSGDIDRGDLNVALFGENENAKFGPEVDELEKEVQEWALSVYDYSGGGDGNVCGDDISYDLARKFATHSGWAYVRTGGSSGELEIAEN